MSMLDTNVITQVGILVNDIEAAAKEFAAFLGTEVPPISESADQSVTQATYNGEPMYGKAKLAFFDAGPNVKIELIEPNMTPSLWRDDLNKNGEGIHHIAFRIKGMKEKTMLLASKGMPVTQKGEYKGGRYAYIDSFKKLKLTLELLENDADLK